MFPSRVTGLFAFQNEERFSDSAEALGRNLFDPITVRSPAFYHSDSLKFTECICYLRNSEDKGWTCQKMDLRGGALAKLTVQTNYPVIVSFARTHTTQLKLTFFLATYPSLLVVPSEITDKVRKINVDKMFTTSW